MLQVQVCSMCKACWTCDVVVFWNVVFCVLYVFEYKRIRGLFSASTYCQLVAPSPWQDITFWWQGTELTQWLLHLDNCKNFILTRSLLNHTWRGCHFLANSVKDDKNVPVLLSSIGSSAYTLLSELLSLEIPGSKCFAEISATLTSRCASLLLKSQLHSLAIFNHRGLQGCSFLCAI